MGPRMLLVAYDGSPASQDAIDDLRRAGLSVRGMAAIVSVADTDRIGDLDERAHAVERPADRAAIEAMPMNRLQRQSLDEAIALSLAGADRLRRRLPDWHVDSLVMTGHPIVAILRAARDCYAELLVVGTHGRSAIERALLGSVSSGLVAGAHCTVRLGRSRAEFGETPLRILVGVDRPAGAEEILRAVAVRDWPLGSAVHILLSETAEAGGEREESAGGNGATETAAPPRLRPSLTELGWHGIEATSRVVDGEFEPVVLETAARWGADLIVLGARDASADIRIASRAQCSVEVVRTLRIPYRYPDEESPA